MIGSNRGGIVTGSDGTIGAATGGVSGSDRANLPSSIQRRGDTTAGRHAIEVFFDGECPLCVREVNMIRKKDEEERILFTDISAPHFHAAARGFTQKELMDEIRAVLPDGRRLSGVEVFRRMYDLIGFRSIVSLTRVWGVRHALDVSYRVWAKNRLRLTGRCEDGVCTT